MMKKCVPFAAWMLSLIQYLSSRKHSGNLVSKLTLYIAGVQVTKRLFLVFT
jgi:hypothetical protein